MSPASSTPVRKEETISTDMTRFAINFTATETGKKSFTGTFKFATCTDENCAPQTAQIAFDVEVK